MDLATALTGFQTKQRKVLEPVDHGKIQYEPYRKNFYVEVPELAKMSQDGEQKLDTSCHCKVKFYTVYIIGTRNMCFLT